MEHVKFSQTYFNNFLFSGHFDKLSDELMLQIFKYIPLKKLVKFSTVSKRWYKLM